MRNILFILLSLVLAVSASAQQALKPGDAAPNFVNQALDGQTYSLNQLQGKIVVLTFWSTRCAICHAEIPKLNQGVQHYKGQEVVFLGVTMDNEVKVDPFIRKNPFNFSILPNAFGIMLQYADKDRDGNINMGFPANFLIDRHGRVAARTSGWDSAQNVDAEVGKLLTSD